MNKESGKLHISGLETCSGGVYDEVSISGKGTFDGEVKCNTFKVSGIAECKEDFECTEGKISGVSKFRSDFKADTLKISGTDTHEGNVEINTLKVSGVIKTEQCLKAQTISNSGILKAGGDINAEVIKVSGIIQCQGMVNCEELKIKGERSNKINEIGASDIRVELYNQGISKFIDFMLPHTPLLEANIIEGDNIYLEKCHVKVVRGRNIELREGCRVDTVEYSGTFEKDSQSQVTNLNKIDS